MPSGGTVLVCAATIPATLVPWPLGSVKPSDPSRMDVPATMFPLKSGCVASIPVSRTATMTEALGTPMPNTRSQLIFGKAHWFGYSGSDGIAVALRVLLTSARTT